MILMPGQWEAKLVEGVVLWWGSSIASPVDGQVFCDSKFQEGE